MTGVLDLFKGLDPDQIREFREEAIKRLAELRAEIIKQKAINKNSQDQHGRQTNEVKK